MTPRTCARGLLEQVERSSALRRDEAAVLGVLRASRNWTRMQTS